MGRAIAITTRHGTVGAWRADPLDGAQRGALVVVQEIFGVNEHIRSVVERYAAEGYVAVAPDMFAPVQPHMELDYGPEGFARGRELAAALGFEQIGRASCRERVERAVGAGRRVRKGQR